MAALRMQGGRRSCGNMGVHPFHDALPFSGVVGHIQFVGGLAVHPELGAVAEVGAQANGRVPGDAAFARHDGLHAALGHAGGKSKPGLADVQGIQKLFQENFPRMHGGHAFHGFHSKDLSMVVDNFNVMGVVVTPSKTNAPLRVDTNAVLPPAIPFQRFKAIGRGDFQVVQRNGVVQHFQLSLRRTKNIRRQGRYAESLKHRFRPCIFERRNHTNLITRQACKCKFCKAIFV